VKLGQTEHGSFVVTLLSPVPPLLDPAQGPTDGSAWKNLNDEPLERTVTRRLMEALEASRNAAEMALSGDAGAFEKAVAAGVSANLCEAVAGLIEQSDGLDVSVTWARTRPAPDAPRKVAFSSKDAETLKEAARTFRRRQPRADVTLFGVVHKLKGTQGEVAGVVTLKAMVDDRVQPVSAVLDQANYGVAVHAHAAKMPVIVIGDLERVGHRWQMTNVNVRELPADEGDD
jgi:predicted aconitase with swiveling domain